MRAGIAAAAGRVGRRSGGVFSAAERRRRAYEAKLQPGGRLARFLRQPYDLLVTSFGFREASTPQQCIAACHCTEPCFAM